MLCKQTSVFGSRGLQLEHYLETITAAGLVFAGLIGPKDGTIINQVRTWCWARWFHIQPLMSFWWFSLVRISTEKPTSRTHRETEVLRNETMCPRDTAQMGRTQMRATVNLTPKPTALCGKHKIQHGANVYLLGTDFVQDEEMLANTFLPSWCFWFEE